jgi:RasGEF domain
VIRHWLLNYFVHDFIPSRQLRLTLTSYINQLAFHPLVRQSVRDQRIVKGLKRVIRRLKMVYYRKAESGNVRIISPPPLTPKQEQIEKLVRDKLMQNPVRRTATTSLSKFKWAGAKMNGNTAISDANLASVVVIGNIDRKVASSKNLHSDLGKKIFGKSSMRAISLTDVRSSVLGAPIRRSIAGHSSEENMKFVSIKTLQMQRRAEIERQQSEVEREYERQRQMEGRPLSIASDDSLESELTAGTTDDELDHVSDDNGSVMGKEKNFEEEIRAHELEIQRRRLEEEEEMKRVKFYAHGDISSTKKSENAIPQSLNIFKTPHSHTVYVERARDTPLPNGKLSAASADAVMASGRKHSKRPGLPADFWAAGVQATTAPSQPNTNPAPATTTESLNSPSQDSIQGSLRTSVRGKQEEDARASFIQGKQFPSGLARELSQKSIERRRSERDLRQLYLKGNQDTLAHENGSSMELVPPVPNIDNKYAPSTYSSVRKSHLSSESSEHAEEMEKTLRRTPSGQFVNMIAEELRRENPDNCVCVACQGIANDTSNCKRLSVLLSSDPERRESIELRHRRGASVDQLSEVTRTSTTSYEVVNHQEGSQVVQNGVSDNDHHHHRASAMKAASTGLSSEEADTIASLPYVERNSVPVLQDIDLLRQVNKNKGEGNRNGNMRYSQVGSPSLRELERMPSVVSALRTVQLKEQQSDINSEVAELAVATSSAGFQDAISEPSSTQSPFAQDESHQFHLEVIETEDRDGFKNANSTTLPLPPSPMKTQPLLDHVPKTKLEARSYFRRSFILYERSESVAQQLCLVERDVLLAVQWEELVHCRWTKMNTHVDERQDGNNDEAQFTDKYQKSPRFDSSLHHGVQDAIQRFNVVCQWVASEIVRAPNLEVRVRTIEKFIRIAEVRDP